MKILILITVIVGVVRYQVPVIKQINTYTSSIINTHIEKTISQNSNPREVLSHVST